MKRILTAIIILASLFITACDDVALGTALNLKGPVVEITGPVSKPNQTDPEVGTIFNFTGTALSESTVTRMTVTLTFFNRVANKMVVMGREWKWETGNWQIRESSDDLWTVYSRKTYQNDLTDYPVGDPDWTIAGKTVYWKLPVYMNRMEKGQYFIEVTAWDNTGNSDSNSKKRLKVEFNNLAPNITIELPVLKDGTGSLSAPKPPDYSGPAYLFDPFGSPRQTYDNRSNFVSRIPELRWTATQGASLEKLTLEITNEHNLDVNDGRKKTYYFDEFQLDDTVFGDRFQSSPSKGNHLSSGLIGDNNGTAYTKVGNDIVLGQGPYAANLASLPKDRITPLQLVTKLRDGVGRTEYKSKGWFMYLPDSDKPFADISFGNKVKDGQNVQPNITDSAVIMRGTTSNKVYFYDDKEGLKQAKYSLVKLQNNSLAADFYVKTDEIINFSNNPTYFAWDFAVDYSYGVGRYKMEVTVTDMSGLEGDKYTAYFTIVSNTTPQILAWPATLADPPNSDRLSTPVWGNNRGDIAFSGRAAVEGAPDGSIKVDRVTVVMINDADPAAGSQNIIRYTDNTYSGWNLGINSGANGATDSFGNRIWEIPQTDINIVNGSPGDNLGDSQRDEYRFTKTFNWFTDLGGASVSGSTKDKRLMVRAVTQGALNKEYYGSRTLTIHGDDGAPELKITTLRLESRPNTSGSWTLLKEYTLPTNETLPALTVNHRVRLSGTWSDNSAENWTIPPAGKSFPHDLFKSISIRWEGNAKQYSFVLPPNNVTTAGTWQTSFFEGFPAEGGNQDPRAMLIARFEDLAGNVKADETEITIETDLPTLARASSDTPNGKYGLNKVIDIFLGFNKDIFLDVTNPATNTTGLSLLLSNGGIATYVTGLGSITIAPNGTITRVTGGSDRIQFQYTVKAADGETPAGGKLNVTQIIWGNTSQTLWKSSEGTAAIFSPYVFVASNSSSFAGQKNIVIDKTPPKISSITSTAADRVYGAGQEIALIVEFDEDIDIAAGISSSTTYINLTGFLPSGTRTAGYNNKAGSRSAQFIYKVAAGDYTYSNGTGGNLTIPATASVSGFNYIQDKAGNNLSSGLINFAGGLPTKQIKIDTQPPAKPGISITPTEGQTYYNDVSLTVSGIETGARWEFHRNFVSEAATTTGWENGSSTYAISLTRSDSYRIAVRQFDNANPENKSDIAYTNNFKINKGDLLTKITSANPSGTYGAGVSGKSTIDIDLEFRINVTASTGYIELNTTGGTVTNPTRAPLKAAGIGTKKLTFTYTIPSGAITPSGEFLNVTGISLTGITDGASTIVIPSNPVTALAAENQLNKQKEIVIITGRPAASTNTLGQAVNTNIWFRGNVLGIRFDRNIYRGSTAEKLMIRQIDTNFAIPTVLTEKQFNDIFSGRGTMFTEHNDILSSNNVTSASAWEKLGSWMYQKGSNGATRGTGTGGPLTADTSLKYVLRFEINSTTGNLAIPSEAGVGVTTLTRANLNALFRAAEALTFTPSDPNVKISGTYLTVELTGDRALPVKGASYDWVFPNGFVTDILGKVNNSSNTDASTGTDTNISSNGATRRLVYTSSGTAETIQTEKPVIRIDKGDDLIYFGRDASDDSILTDPNNNTEGRQARQKLVTKVKMDCRTPGASITYWSRNAQDKVRPIIRRSTGNNMNTPTAVTTGNNGNAAANERGMYFLPFLGRYRTRESWEQTRMRPQSGGGTWTTATGLNHYTPVTSGNAWPTRNATTGYAETYGTPFNIGTLNYSDGGIEYNYVAAATATNMAISEDSYETAYRSVFVYNTTDINSNGNRPTWTSNTTTDTAYGIVAARQRVWIRGSNTSQGDPTISDFPLSRSRDLWRKIKLLTPINPGNLATQDVNLTDSDIPTAGNQNANGYHLWFWVTWRINVPAFVDIQYAELPVGTDLTNDNYGIQAPHGNTIRKLFQSFVTSVEHYAVHPGRTTIVETRNQGQMWDGDHGSLLMTSKESPMSPSDK